MEVTKKRFGDKGPKEEICFYPKEEIFFYAVTTSVIDPGSKGGGISFSFDLEGNEFDNKPICSGDGILIGSEYLSNIKNRVYFVRDSSELGYVLADPIVIDSHVIHSIPPGTILKISKPYKFKNF